MLNKRWKEVTGNIINNLSRLLFDKNQTRSQCTERPEQQQWQAHTHAHARRGFDQISSRKKSMAVNQSWPRIWTSDAPTNQTQRIKQRHERSRERLTQQQWVNKEEPEKLKLLRKIGIYQTQVSCGRNVQSTPRAPSPFGTGAPFQVQYSILYT